MMTNLLKDDTFSRLSNYCKLNPIETNNWKIITSNELHGQIIFNDYVPFLICIDIRFDFITFAKLSRQLGVTFYPIITIDNKNITWHVDNVYEIPILKKIFESISNADILNNIDIIATLLLSDDTYSSIKEKKLRQFHSVIQYYHMPYGT